MPQTIENKTIENSTDMISAQQTQDLLARLETPKPELSQFAEQMQDNLKTKNFPDKN